jgi:hypothetical protein
VSIGNVRAQTHVLPLLFAFFEHSDENKFSFWLYGAPICGFYVAKQLKPLFHFRKIQSDISGGDEIEDIRAVYKIVVLTIAGPPFQLPLFDKQPFINNTL